MLIAPSSGVEGEVLESLHVLDHGDLALVFDQAKAFDDGGTVLENSSTTIGALDTFIAAQALSLGATLVTSNTKEFARVPGLQIED